MLARLAVTVEGCCLGLQREAVVACEVVGEYVEEIGSGLDDAAAVVADQVVVVMSALHEVEDGRAGCEVNGSDDTELSEAVERPIHGRLVKDRVVAADDLDDVGRREVMVAAHQHGFHDQPPRTRDPAAALTQSFEDASGSLVFHAAQRYRRSVQQDDDDEQRIPGE